MMGTGFIKCMPMTLSGRFVLDAILVIEIEDVFEASITPGRAISSIAWKTLHLISTFSTTASMTKSAFDSAGLFVAGTICDKAAALSFAVILPFATSRSRFFAIVDRA